MKNYRLTALVLAMVMLFHTLPVFALSVDDVKISASEDTCIVGGSRWQHTNYGNDAYMLFGPVYDRTALIKFDLSSVDLASYNGAMLEITFGASSETGDIYAYVVDGEWSEKSLTYANFSGEYGFVISTGVARGPKQHLTLNVNTALKLVKQSESKTMSIALKSRKGNINVFSSEASDKTLSPTLILKKEAAYVDGQYDFEMPDITGAMLKTEYQKAVSKGHPRMIATKANIAKVKEYAFGKDKNLTQLYSNVKAKADKLLTTENVSIDNEIASKSSYLSSADNIMTNARTLCLAYLIEGDERYAQKAWSQAEYLCTLKTWGTSARIDHTRLLIALSVCYDWLYDWLDDNQKEILINGVRTLSLNRASDVYHNPYNDKYKYAFDQFLVDSSTNHCTQNALGIFYATLAFAETDIDFMVDLEAYNLPYFLKCITGLYPDGVWREGPSYWRFVCPYTAELMQVMTSSFGHCFGLNEIPFLKNLANYAIYTASDEGFFNVGDSHFNHSYEYDISYYMMGSLADDMSLQSYAIQEGVSRNSSEPITVLLYDPAKTYDGELSLILDKMLRGSMYQAVMRSSFEGTQPVFAGMNVKRRFQGFNSHADSGTLAFDALGERWITNNSKETYYHGYSGGGDMERYSWYRTHAEANSCIVIDPSELPGQDFYQGLSINSFVSNPGGAYAVADLTKAYATWADSYKRGIQLTDNRKAFVVQDELVLKQPSEVYSFFNIWEADIEILDDGKSAIISKNNKKVYVTIDCDQEFTLSRMLAEPLPTSAKPAPSKPNSPNADFLKLALHFDSIESANIRVCFMPYICDEELESITCKEFVPMSDWTAPSEMKAPPQLIDIKIGGKSIEGFNPYDRCYETESKVSKEEITASYDNTKYDVTIRNADRDGVVNILVVDKNDKTNINSYLIGMPVLPEPSFVDTSDMSVLTITKCTAPESQVGYGVDKLFDDDFSTRWSENGAGKVMNIQLDKVRKVGCIAVATYMENDARRQNFDVELSLDGKTWTHVGRFRSSGMTLDPEYYDLGNTEAAYVRVTWNSSNVSGWNSITELKLYGQ